MESYFFGTPASGPYQPWLIVGAVVLIGIAIAAHVVSRRNGYTAVRRRARSLRFITAGLAATVIGHLVARGLTLDVLAWRIWAYLLGAYFLGRLIWWGLDFRSLRHDKVDELNRNRKQLYFNKSRRRPSKRRKRRR
jgi:hypothetical protein